MVDQAAVKTLKKADQGKNGAALLEGDAYSWAFDLGATQLMRSNDRRDPVHFDGGASFVHGGLTLGGERTLVLREKEGPNRQLQVRMVPGHFYLGCLCGPEHFVQHHSSLQLFQTGSLGPVELVLLLRSRVFREARASGQQSGPVPKALWATLAPVMAECFAQQRWVLPALSLVKEVELRLTLAGEAD